MMPQFLSKETHAQEKYTSHVEVGDTAKRTGTPHLKTKVRLGLRQKGDEMNKRSTLQFWKSTRRKMQMGLGTLGSKVKCPECDEEFSHCQHIVFKRKFRWVFEGETTKAKFEPLFVKVAARPQLEIEETEINFLASKTWVPGKQWEKMTVTAWDVKQDFWDTIMPLLVEEGKEPTPEQLGTFKLGLYDGCGCLIESWMLEEATISGIRFGELDYSSSETCDIEFDVKYKKVTYKNECGQNLKYLPCHLGGGYKPNKATCPNCKHEFVVGNSGIGMLGNPNIIF